MGLTPAAAWLSLPPVNFKAYPLQGSSLAVMCALAGLGMVAGCRGTVPPPPVAPVSHPAWAPAVAPSVAEEPAAAETEMTEALPPAPAPSEQAAPGQAKEPLPAERQSGPARPEEESPEALPAAGLPGDEDFAAAAAAETGEEEPEPDWARLVRGQHVPVVFLPGIGERWIFGWVEWVCLEPEGVLMKAKADSGALTSSLCAQNLVEFERDGKRWVRFSLRVSHQGETVVIERPVVRHARIVQHHGRPQRRPVVELEMRMGPLHDRVEFSLVDRTNFTYPVLVGRNFLRGLGLIDPEETFLWRRPCGR